MGWVAFGGWGGAHVAGV